MKKYNIIGDVHGRTSWKELVINGAVNIFVGDYFSPYVPMEYEDVRNNFLDIIQYKLDHPETILLMGNHDEDHWHNFRSGCCRHDYGRDEEIRRLFEENADLFQAAYSIDNQILVTHAGVSSIWYANHFCRDWDDKESWGNDMDEEIRLKLTPDEIAKNINKLFKEDPIKGFSFMSNTWSPDDCYGCSPTHSPMWGRRTCVEPYNIFRGHKGKYVQVFGHTISSEIELWGDEDPLVMVDCLQRSKESLLIEIDEKHDLKVSIHKL